MYSIVLYLILNFPLLPFTKHFLPTSHLTGSSDLFKPMFIQSSLLCSGHSICLLASGSFYSVPTSILAKWPVHDMIIQVSTNVPIKLYHIPISFPRSSILLFMYSCNSLNPVFVTNLCLQSLLLSRRCLQHHCLCQARPYRHGSVFFYNSV